MGSLAFAAVAIALVVVAAVEVRKRRARALTGDDSTLQVTRFIAVVYAALTLIFTVVSVVTTLVSDAVDVALPVRQFWPEPHQWIEIEQGPTASVTGGGFSLAEVTVSGLGTDARLVLAAGHALQGLTFTVIAIVVALLCHRLLGGLPFRAALSRSITLTAVVIAAGGVLWQVCFWVGGSIASAQVLTVTGWQSHELRAVDPTVDLGDFDPLVTGLPEPTIALTIDFWPLFLGLALVAVAAAFRYGERLQRDTDGLV